MAAPRAGHRVEVVAWAADGDPERVVEKAAMDALAAVFAARFPGREFVNPVAGEPDPVAAFHARMLADDPPDSFQVHPGGELLERIEAGALVDLTDRFARWGLLDVVPAGLVEALSAAGGIYSLPAGIHRLMLWNNPAVLAGAGITAGPSSPAEFLDGLAALRAAGVRYPLALAANWTQLELLEAMLLAGLGADRFASLWTEDADWSGADVTGVLRDYRRVLSYANPNRDDLHWTEAAKLVSAGEAGYLFMGDWVAGEFEDQGFPDYGYQPFPGTEDAFQWLADAFVLPRNAPNPRGAEDWLLAVASPEGQRVFNTIKGSTPIRRDADPGDYPAYQRASIADLGSLRLVPSCAHGSACPPARTMAAIVAAGRFSADGDIEGLRAGLAAYQAGGGER